MLAHVLGASEGETGVNTVLITSATTIVVALIGVIGSSFKRSDKKEDPPPPAPQPAPSQVLTVPPTATPDPEELPSPRRRRRRHDEDDEDDDDEPLLVLIDKRDQEIIRLMGILAGSGIDPRTGIRVRSEEP